MKKVKEDDEKENIPFNGSLDTLARINELISHISVYRVNGHWLGLKENLGELLNEAQGCLSKEEFKKAWKDWDSIEEFDITIDNDGYVTFDDELPGKLKRFSSWIRLKLYRHNLTMAKRFDQIDRVDQMYKRYGI